MTGVDEALKVPPIDPNRLGITGWSYGGYMTMWAVTQTNRFKAPWPEQASPTGSPITAKT